MDKLLTIVIPSYNMEKYLRRCLDSLLIDNSTLFNRLEVLIINDGSKDSTSAIAHEYESKYPDVFHVIDKENGNYGSCVNRGIDEATGMYFRILDADDYFDKGNLGRFISFLSQLSDMPDLFLTNYSIDFIGGNSKIVSNYSYKSYVIYNISDLTFDNDIRNCFLVMHRMTYRLEILRNSRLRHQEGISYTDSEYCFYPMREVKCIMFIDTVLYHYQVGRDGQTVSTASYQKNIHNIYKIIDRMITSISNKEKDAVYYPALISILRMVLYPYYKTILTTRFSHNEDIVCIEKRILSMDVDLYNSLKSFKIYRTIPFVYLWRHGVKTNSKFFTYIYRRIDALFLR